VDVMDINLDDFTPAQLAQLNDELQQQLTVYMRHVVGVAGAYEVCTSNGVQPQTPFYFSAMVIDINDQWYLLSAGHAFQEIETLIDSPDAELVRCGIDDTFLNQTASQPFDFDYAAAKRCVHFNSVFDDGLDYALIEIAPYYRKLLTANGIVPLTKQHWDPDSVAASSTFLMAGFPNDSIDAGITHHGDFYRARAKGKANFLYIERGTSNVKTDFTRFVGQIRREHNIADITGMSGGPIFCFNDADLTPYFVAGVQSKWDPETQTTFACPISTILEHADAVLRETAS
jgi:hypothetical protein